tara:strand:+ start:929 stop:2002 length:1074 start_codon:yes stop_codon:yes gene_type:complete
MINKKIYINSEKFTSDDQYSKIISQLESIQDSPKLFPFSLDIQNNKIDFVEMDRSHYKKSFFIMSPGKGPGYLKSKSSFSMKFDDIVDIFKEIKFVNNSAIIFNHGFCCGTLLTRLLEESFNVLSLKEPPLLHTLKHHLENNKNDITIKNTIFCLHNRSFSKKQRVLWKPSDYAFDLIEHTEPLNIPSIYLYSPLREYIASCSKEKRDQWIKNRANFEKILNYLEISNIKIDITKTANQAMLYWLYFAKKFIHFSSRSNNLFAINSKDLLDNPTVITVVGKHLKLNRKINIFEKFRTKKILNTYAKTDNYVFNKDIRAEQLNKIINDNQSDINDAEKIAEEVLKRDIRNFRFEKELI